MSTSCCCMASQSASPVLPVSSSASVTSGRGSAACLSSVFCAHCGTTWRMPTVFSRCNPEISTGWNGGRTSHSMCPCKVLQVPLQRLARKLMEAPGALPIKGCSKFRRQHMLGTAGMADFVKIFNKQALR